MSSLSIRKCKRLEYNAKKNNVLILRKRSMYTSSAFKLELPLMLHNTTKKSNTYYHRFQNALTPTQFYRVDAVS